MYQKRTVVFITLIIASLLCSIPVLPAIEKSSISLHYSSKDIIKAHIEKSSLIQSQKTVLQQLAMIFLLIIKISIVIDLSVFLTILIELIILPLAVEFDLSPIMFLLLMIISLRIPIKIINGFCLKNQQRYNLTNQQTELLTRFLVFSTIMKIIFV